jgi:hypothetical protein
VASRHGRLQWRASLFGAHRGTTSKPTASSTTIIAEARPEVGTRSHGLLLIAILASSSATSRAIAAGTTTKSATGLARRRVKCGRLNGGWEVEECAEIVNAQVSEVVVIVLPRESFAHVFARLERFHDIEDVKVWNVDFRVLLLHEVLLDNTDAILEQLAIDCNTILLRHQHGGGPWCKDA